MTEREPIKELKNKPSKVILTCRECAFTIEWTGAPWDIFVGFASLSELGYRHAIAKKHAISIHTEHGT